MHPKDMFLQHYKYISDSRLILPSDITYHPLTSNVNAKKYFARLRSIMRKKSVVFTLLTTLTIMFIIEIATHKMGDEVALLSLGALPASGQLNGEYWRLITYSLLHLNWQHIILNLVALWWLGNLVERRAGSTQAAVIYALGVVLGGIGIWIGHVLYPSTGSTVGASAGIFGLPGAPLILVNRRDAQSFNSSRRPIIGLWIFLVFSLVISFLPGVSSIGHIGGLIAGLVSGLLVKVKNPATLN